METQSALMSPSDKSLSGSMVSDDNDASVSRSPSTYSIREDKWPDLVVSRPRKLDAWWSPRRELFIFLYVFISSLFIILLSTIIWMTINYVGSKRHF